MTLSKATYIYNVFDYNCSWLCYNWSVLDLSYFLFFYSFTLHLWLLLSFLKKRKLYCSVVATFLKVHHLLTGENKEIIYFFTWLFMLFAYHYKSTCKQKSAKSEKGFKAWQESFYTIMTIPRSGQPINISQRMNWWLIQETIMEPSQTSKGL